MVTKIKSYGNFFFFYFAHKQTHIMKVGKQFFLIRINKALQAAKQEKTEDGMYLSPKYLDMKYNLQHGTIVDIGTVAQQTFPEAQPGDTLIFRHVVESQSWRVLERNPETDDEDTLVDITSGGEVYAIVTAAGQWLVNKTYVFLEGQYSLIRNTEFTGLLPMDNPEVFLQEDYIMNRIEELKTDQLQLKQSVECVKDAYEFESQMGEMDKIKQQLAQLGQWMHSTKFCNARVALVNPETSAITGMVPGCNIFIDHQVLYELNLEAFGRKYFVAYTRMVEGIL
jgi:hypothetical protein